MKRRVNHGVGAFLLALLLLASGCGETWLPEDRSVLEVDFSDTVPSNPPQDESAVPLRIAVAAMTSPKETFTSYEELLHYVSTKTGRPVKLEQRKTYKEINTLLASRQIEMAFICSGAYVEAREQFPLEILAVPVVRGKATYRAYVIAHRSSSIERFEDLQGKSFAFTDPLSNSGRLYALKRVEDLGRTPETFFSQTLFTHGHDYSIRAVAHQIVAGATVDGLIFDYLKARTPEAVQNVRVVEVSEEYGMPPVVVHKDLDADLKEELRDVLLHMHLDDAGQAILALLLIDQFAPGREADYRSIQKNLEEAKVSLETSVETMLTP